MANVKVQTQKISRFGNNITLPNGEVAQVSDSGILEVESSIAKELVEAGHGWSYPVGKAPKVEAPVADEANADEPAASEDMSEKTKAELVELCNNAGLPASEWKTLNKADLVAYLESKIK